MWMENANIPCVRCITFLKDRTTNISVVAQVTFDKIIVIQCKHVCATAFG